MRKSMCGDKTIKRQVRFMLFNTYSMKQPDLYYFEAIKMTSQA